MMRASIPAFLTLFFVAPHARSADDLRDELDGRIAELTGALEAAPDDVQLYARRGDAYLFRARFDDAVRDYEKTVELDPGLERSHWRRGIAYFYAKRYRDAARQFELYHGFDDVDRENGIWRFLSQAKAHGLEKARKNLLKYKKTDREPLGDIYRMFAGATTASQILERIRAAEISDDEREKRLFYAELYSGLFEFISSRHDAALEHLEKAVANRWGPRAGFGPRYMWHVARVHRDLLRERNRDLAFEITLTTARKGFDGMTCWVHARGGAIPPGVPGNPGRTHAVVVTLQKLLLSRSDVFYGLHDMRTDDLGATWSPPTEHETLARRRPTATREVVPCDFTPKWHARTGTLLGTGKTFWYDIATNDHVPNAPSEIAYAVYDATTRSWRRWKTVKLPDEKRFERANAGCAQRHDLPNGDILLPIYFRESAGRYSAVTVLRCSFDGETLTYLEHGTVFEVEERRGLAEPSVTRFGDRFYLTARHDLRAYVTSGNDGLRFEPLRPWRFDDGSELGSYNTQQHWATHSDALFLVYTRRGAKNDHVFRHRAPLFIARVDPERLVVLRETERVVVPERGTRLGNFGVFDVGENETWVSTCEWMQPRGVEKRGSDNNVFIAKLSWNRPNRLVSR